MFRRCATTALATVVASALATCVEPTAGASGGRLPDLVVAGLGAHPEVQAGHRLRVSVTAENVGRKRAPRSTTKVYLSADRKPGRDAAKASIGAPRLAPGNKDAATVRLLVPAGTPAGTYRLLACADATRQVTESREDNNCRVMRRSVRVTPPTGAPDFPLAPDPLTVVPHVDGSHATSLFVTDVTQAATITATGADGTTYTLALPGGALIAPETITLTPLSSVGGLPLSGGLAAGVQLEPHGLVLLKQATLAIDSPDLGPLAQQTAFYFHQGGEDFHLYPVMLPETGDGADVVRLPIDHFSTPGVGLGTDSDRAGALSHPPARDQGQVAAAVSDLLRKAREADPNGDGSLDPSVGQQFEAIMNDYYDGVVRPQLLAAEQHPENDALVRKALADALAWNRNLQLFLGGDDGYGSPRTDESWDLIERVLKAVYLDRWARCSQQHELEVLPELISVARQAQLLGYAWGEAAYQRFLDCSRFEVRLDSRVTFAGTWPVGGEELFDFPRTGAGSWRAQAKTTNSLGEGTVFAEAPLPFTQAAYHDHYSYPRSDGSTCAGGSDQTGSVPGTLRTAVVPSFEANPREVPPDGGYQEPQVDLVISATVTGAKDVVHTVDCGGGDYTDTFESKWQDRFTDFHGGQTLSVTGTKGDRSADLLYAKTWDNSVSIPNHLGSEDWDETTVLEVWHKPAT